MPSIALAKRVQEVMARENTVSTLQEALHQLNLENKRRRDVESKLFDEQLIKAHRERKSFREEIKDGFTLR